VGFHWEGSIINCYSTGPVSGTEEVGGLVGLIWEGSITNCYSTGLVSGTEEVGGLVGYDKWENGVINSSYWDIETSGQITSAGGIGKSTAVMQMASTFVGWGGDLAWTIDEDKDYPRLWWENMPGEPIPTGFYYGGGSGTAENPFLIYTAEQMYAIGTNPNDRDKHFKLMADIDLSAFMRTDFNIIGYYVSHSDNNPFTGVFDGNGHTISNFSYTSTNRDYVGLFGYVGGNAEIKDLGLIGPTVDAGIGSYVGSLVGYMGRGKINNCYAEGVTVVGHNGVGGLVGYNDYWLCNITMSYSTGEVRGNGWYVGGLIGFNTGYVTNCYSTCMVTGDSIVGGLVGRNGSYYWFFSPIGGTILKCYSIGAVLGNETIGGLVGVNDEEGEIRDSFWDIDVSGQTTSHGGTSKTTTEMQTANTFLEVGWDFVDEVENGIDNTWWIDEGNDYPRLWWELNLSADHLDYDEWIKVGEPVCWCYKRQCHGDTDGKPQGRQQYWVSTNDLDVLIAAWNKPFAEIDGRTVNGAALICADFDHKAQGKENYRVSTDDLDILIANWNQANAPAPDCP
jgi:hypothetical protein